MDFMNFDNFEDFDDFEDFVKFDFLFDDDEPLRHRSTPPSSKGSGCLTVCMIMAVVILLAFI